MSDVKLLPIPSFLRDNQDIHTKTKILHNNWEVRNERILAVTGTNIILLWGSTKEYRTLKYYADTHNFNKMLGITDIEYNKTYTNK